MILNYLRSGLTIIILTLSIFNLYFPFLQLCGLIGEISFYSLVEREFEVEAFDLALDILNGIFLEDSSEVNELLATVPFIPDIPQLKRLRAKHFTLLKTATLEESVNHLCSMLRHESSQVRVVVLRRLLGLIKEERKNLFSGISHVVTKQNNVVTVLVTHLLSLCAREADRSARDVCAQCLGYFIICNIYHRHIYFVIFLFLLLVSLR